MLIVEAAEAWMPSVAMSIVVDISRVSDSVAQNANLSRSWVRALKMKISLQD